MATCKKTNTSSCIAAAHCCLICSIQSHTRVKAFVSIYHNPVVAVEAKSSKFWSIFSIKLCYQETKLPQMFIKITQIK